mmetsp:Transcript_71629/g.64304  ORF Transcript_71629/g.64304 Transcript_71629/m.64304 type:complete len:252 (-) Transcript_71629:157-912(-)
MFIALSLLITIYIEICSSAVSIGGEMCLTGRGPYMQVFGGLYENVGCSTPPPAVLQVPDGNGGFKLIDASGPPYIKCEGDKVLVDEDMQTISEISLKTYIGGENNENKYIIISLNNFADENYELYCNTDADKVAEMGFRNPVPLDSDPTLLCGGTLDDRASLRSIQVIDGSCSAQCEENVLGDCDVNERTGRGLSQCCYGLNRRIVSYREGCDKSSGFVTYLEPDPICCTSPFVRTSCGNPGPIEFEHAVA